ncbi:membrane protein [Planotetraspora thailandica]|uniref:Membrane protein n=1 Tax=Planotetraspora thailandica TaxID=487172 RepID=A0A8J3V195_9ACTN|nr:DMT family transporter [Planotetraspora thailandica]GII54385.1 membrane protein [Planotetraspora thailandica]
MSARGWALFLMMCVIWGIPYLLIKVAVDGVSVPVLVFARTVIGAAVLLPLAFRAGGFAVVRRHWRPLLVFAIIEIIAPWWLLSDAERRVDSSLAALVIASAPIIAVVMLRAMGDSERLTPMRWAGLLVGLAGVAALVGPNLRGGDPWAVIELLLTTCGYAAASLLVARKLGDVPGIPMTAVCLASTALVYTPAAVATWPAAMPSAGVLGALAGLGVICTAVAFVTFFALIREVGPTRAMVFTYVNPVVAIAAGAVVLDEPVTWLMVAATALILGGSAMAAGKRKEEPGRPAPVAAVAETN